MTPALEDDVATALESGHPIDVLMLASALLAGLDPDLVGSERPDGGLPPPATFVRMFLEPDDPYLHTLAWTVAQLLPDPGLQAEVATALATDTLPAWLESVAHPEVVAAWQATDPLRDSTDVVISLRIGDEDLTFVGLIDFNQNGALKDGFAVPAPLPALQDAFAASGATGLVSWELSPADARAWLFEAIAVGRRTDPPFTSDSWPQARPLLEWAARLCPPGGAGWSRQVLSVEDTEEAVDRFAASPGGGVVANPESRTVLVDALRLLARHSYGDPLLLSAVKLEMGLGFLWATALDHDLDRMLALPDALGPFVRWAHAQRGVPADDTDEALAAIAHRRAEYVRDVAEAFGSDDGSSEH